MDLLIVGASARAAAHSALRAGLVPAAIDLFADTDLTAIAHTRRLAADRFPHDLPSAARTFPPGPFLYTGGLENHPDILAAIARDRPLWGVDPDTLRAIRDPSCVRGILRRAGLPSADVHETIRGLPRDGSWLLKPRDSAGGLRIRPLEAATIPPRDGPYYAQERLRGRSLGALFLGAPPLVGFLGATESRRGAPGEPFAYAGGVGPVPLSASLRERITAIGRILLASFDLRGLFGVDLIERDEIPIPIEINPRYTASVEILERALGLALLAAPHKRVDITTLGNPSRIVGKAIVYANSPLLFPGFRSTLRGGGSRFADIPAPGTPIAAGEPVLTVFASGRSPADTHRRLDRLVARITRILDDFGEPFSPESRTM